MSIQKVKKKGKVVKDALGRTKYEVRWLESGAHRAKRIWAANDHEARKAELELTGTAPSGLSWHRAATEFFGGKQHTEKYRQELSRIIDQIAAELPPPEELSLPQAREWLRAKAAATTGRSANKQLAMLLSVCRWCRSQGLLEEIPWEHVAKAPHTPKPRGAFTLEKLPRYLEALPPCARLFAEALLATGERVTAMANLTWADVGDEVATVTIKGGSLRDLPLGRRLREVLAEAAKAAPPSPGAPVFRNSRGNRWTDTAFNHACRKAWDKASLPPRTPHEFRHTFGTMAAREGFSRDQIRAAMGHRDSSTADHYVHLAEDMDSAREVADAVARKIHATTTPRMPPQAPTAPHDPPPPHTTATCPKCGHKFLLGKEEGPNP